MDERILEQTKFWVSTLTTVAGKTQTSIQELKGMDVFEFFSLLSVVEEKSKK